MARSMSPAERLLIERIEYERRARERAEDIAAEYREAFTFLLADPDFPPIHTRLRRHLKSKRD